MMKRKKVLLISPGLSKSIFATFRTLEPGHPLGLAYLAAVLEKNNVQVRIFDNHTLKKPYKCIIDSLSEFPADVVGIACTTATYLSCISVASLIRKYYPDKIIVSGGPHPTLFPKQMLKTGFFDAVFVGEAESALCDFVLSDSIDEWKDIKGIVFKQAGEFISTGKPEPIANLDDLPMPARHLLPMHKYPKVIGLLDVSPVYSINSSRGCPYSCSFCSCRIVGGPGFRSFSPGYIVDEIEYLINKYRARGIYFRENCFTANPKRVIELCYLIKKRKIDIQWVCESRVDTIDEDIVREMAQAGCRSIWFGVETGSERVLETIAKKNTVKKKIVEAFALCKKYRIKTGASIMLGLLGETKKEMYETLDFANRLDPYWSWFIPYRCMPGSEMYNMVIKKGCYDKINEGGTVCLKTDEFDERKLKRITFDICLKYLFSNPKRILRYLTELFRIGFSIENIRARLES